MLGWSPPTARDRCLSVETGLQEQALVSYTGLPAPPAPGLPLLGVRALVADSSATSRLILRRYLHSWGCYAQEAACDGRAIDALHGAAQRGDPFRLALLDIQMPEMDGFATCRRIKSDPLIRDTVVIALSPGPPHGRAAWLRDIGFADFLQKPVRPSHLYNILLDALASGVSARRPACYVLVADDDPINRSVALQILERAGCRAVAVSNGRQAVEAAATGHYDLILMDLRMPEMDGLKTATEIRRHSGVAKGVPIIAMTTTPWAIDRDRCLAAGMDDYLPKPLLMDELQESLRCWTGPRT